MLAMELAECDLFSYVKKRGAAGIDLDQVYKESVFNTPKGLRMTVIALKDNEYHSKKQLDN